MAGQRETNTMAEVGQKILAEITKAKVMPDADLPFLVSLETQVLQYLRAPTPATQSMAGHQMPPMPPGAPPGSPAAPLAAPMPPPDELRRMLG